MAKQKIIVENVMKVLDLSSSSLPQEFIDFIKKQNPTYRDTNDLNEHLYSPNSIAEEMPDDQEEAEASEGRNAIVLNTFDKVYDLCSKRNAGYFRIIL